MVLALGLAGLIRLPVLLRCSALGLACIDFPALGMLGGWGWLLAFFAVGMVLYKLRDTRIFDGRIALAALAGLVRQHPASAVHPAVPALRLLSRALARAQPPLAGHPRGALRRSLLWPLHLWLAVGAGGDLGAAAAMPPGGRCSCWRCRSPAALAFLSWHLVERPALRLKPRTACRRPRSTRDRAGDLSHGDPDPLPPRLRPSIRRRRDGCRRWCAASSRATPAPSPSRAPAPISSATARSR